MLVIPSVIFSSILLVFARANSSLKHNEIKVKKLFKFTKLENYSSYLRIMIKNERDIARIKNNKFNNL